MIEPANRFIRLKDAPAFFGVRRGAFNKYFRPSLTEIPLGASAQSGILFDRLEMDVLADKIKERNGRPGLKGENIPWDVNKDRNWSNAKARQAGISKAASSKRELDRALEQVLGKKPS